MSKQVVDSENVIASLEFAPDKLRAEIGQYYLSDDDEMLRSENFSSGKIRTANIVDGSINNQVLVPIKHTDSL